MEGDDSTALRREDRWRPVRLPAAAAGLVLVERVLMDEVGSPATLARALGDLGRSWADPVASVLDLIALLAETVVAYGLVVLLLHSLCMLPGLGGRVAGRVTSLVTPAVVRRLLDLLVGGALLAQATLAAAPGGAPPALRWSGPQLASVAASVAASPAGGAADPAMPSGPAETSRADGWPRWPVDAIAPAGARPAPRRSAAPLPPWLGGGPSNPAPGPGDEAAETARPGRGPGARSSTSPRQGDEAGGTGAPRQGGDAGDRAPGQRPEGGGARASGHVVKLGDTLWDIAAARLAPAERTGANVGRYWRQIYRANRSVIGADPDLILPGIRLDVPPFRRGRP